MCTGGKASSTSIMEASELKGSPPSTPRPQTDDHADIAGSLLDLTPRPKTFMDKFLCKENSDQQVPILAEYFGVALAFAALGALIRGDKLTSEMKFSPRLQKLGLQVMLKSAMDRLQVLALNAQDLEQRVKESKDAARRDFEAWEAEKRTLLQKLTVTEAQIARVERSRVEDAKANEKVVGIFASYEQGWKNERKKLRREIELLRNEIVGLRNRSQQVGGDGCDECKAKERELEKLEDKLCEKEFLMIATMEEARSDQHERNQLAGKLAMVELLVADLKEKLSNETTKKDELSELMTDVKGKQEEAENKLAVAMVDLENARREIESLTATKNDQNAVIEELWDDLTLLQKDVDEKEEVIAVLLKRASIDREEKEDLSMHLAQAKSKRKAAEAEKDRWKRLAEERARIVPTGKESHRARRSLGSKAELDKFTEIQRNHNEEVLGLRSMYVSKLESLEKQLKSYEEKVAMLEAKILVHSKRIVSEGERSKEAFKSREILNGHELVTLLESMEPDVEAAQFDTVSEIQEVPTTTLAFKDWVKSWLQAVKAQHARHLEQRHWRELDAFERQMRVKDERMGSFRWQLVGMETDFKKMKSELETLRGRLAMAMDEKCRVEREVEGKDKELRALLKTMLHNSETLSAPDSDVDEISHQEAQQRVLTLLQKELKDAKMRLMEIEQEHHNNLLKVAEDAEVELGQKDYQLAVVEAKLCQLKLQIENEKRMSQKVAPDNPLQQVVPDKPPKAAVAGAQEKHIKHAISTACSEVEKLADKIAEVRKQMMESTDGSGLMELIDQANRISNSQLKLSILKDTLSVETADNILAQNQETIAKDLEAVSQALRNFSSDHLELVVEQESLDLPHPHTDEASTSGGNSCAYGGEQTEDDYMYMETEGEVNSKEEHEHEHEHKHAQGHEHEHEHEHGHEHEHEQDEDSVRLGEPEIDFDDMTGDEQSADTKTTDTKSQTSRKRARRKTLKEYFLDSPPELAAENAYNGPILDLGMQKDAFKVPGQGILQTREKNVLAEITPLQDVAGNHLQSATPLFQKLQSKKRESLKTRGDIHVLGLALEVRKIEEQLGQIDKRCAKLADVVVNPTTGLPIPKISPPKKQNKQLAALTGKVGQLAKQMGLTLEKSPEMVTDSTLFNRMPTKSELLSLQHRAEAVNQSLALIEAQEPEDSSDEFAVQTGYSKDRLVDTVKTHLSAEEFEFKNGAPDCTAGCSCPDTFRACKMKGGCSGTCCSAFTCNLWRIDKILGSRQESSLRHRIIIIKAQDTST